nr:Calcineurin B-like protein 1 [Ipomoea batatas]
MKLADVTIEIILDKTFLEADMNLDGKIDKCEWHTFVTKNPPLMKIMTLSYLSLDPLKSRCSIHLNHISNIGSKDHIWFEELLTGLRTDYVPDCLKKLPD